MTVMRGKEVKVLVQGLVGDELQTRTSSIACWLLDPLPSTAVLLPTLTGPTYPETHPLVVVCIVIFFGKRIKQVICTLIL